MTFDIACIRMSRRVWTFLNAAAGRIVERLPFSRRTRFPGTHLDGIDDALHHPDAEERGGHPHRGELRGGMVLRFFARAYLPTLAAPVYSRLIRRMSRTPAGRSRRRTPRCPGSRTPVTRTPSRGNSGRLRPGRKGPRRGSRAERSTVFPASPTRAGSPAGGAGPWRRECRCRRRPRPPSPSPSFVAASGTGL